MATKDPEKSGIIIAQLKKTNERLTAELDAANTTIRLLEEKVSQITQEEALLLAQALLYELGRNGMNPKTRAEGGRYLSRRIMQLYCWALSVPQDVIKE